MRATRLLSYASSAAATATVTGCSGWQSALQPASPEAELITILSWVMFAVAALVTLVVLTLLLAGVFRARGTRPARPLAARHSRRLVWAGGVVLPLVVTVPFVISSFSIGRVVDAPAPADAMKIEVVGKLWWWEVNYLASDGRPIATTANEIHLPVGRPVRFLLRSDNVIHSYWVPNLHGKVDMIPGRTNTLNVTVQEPGIYRGQCAEFCGTQHALMAFLVIAEPPAAFARWLARERRPAAEPTTPSGLRGREVFLNTSCVECHAIRGTPADARDGPDLTHIASRMTLAAATLPNRTGHLGGWIADPQSAKPGNGMPPPEELPPEDFHALLQYLRELR